MKTRKVIPILLVLVLCFCLMNVFPQVRGLTNDWSMFHYDSSHSGSSISNTSILDPAPIWNFPTGDFVESSPAVVNGVVYIGSNDYNVYALNASSGNKIWNFATLDVVESSPAIVDGVVYVGSWDGNVYALNATSGSQIWNYTTRGVVESSPTVVNGVVYVGSDDGRVYALNATSGLQIWNYTTGYIVHSSPAVVGGTVFVGSLDNNVYALNALTGSLLWNYTTGYYVYSSPAVVKGIVYVGSLDNRVYALNATSGSQMWNYTAGGQVFSSPAVVNGVVYVGSDDGRVNALNALSGSEIWRSSQFGLIHSSPAVVNGVVYVGSLDQNVYALNASSGNQKWNFTTGGYVFSSPAVVDGVVYFGSRDGRVYALIGGVGGMGLSMQSPLSAIAGNLLTCTLFYTNFGANNASNVKIETTLPSNVAFNSVSDGGTYNFSTRKVTWSMTSVPAYPAGSGFRIVTVSILKDAPNGAVLEFSGSIQSSSLDVWYGDNYASTNSTVKAVNLPPGLSITPISDVTSDMIFLNWEDNITITYEGLANAVYVMIIFEDGTNITSRMTGYNTTDSQTQTQSFKSTGSTPTILQVSGDDDSDRGFTFQHHKYNGPPLKNYENEHGEKEPKHGEASIWIKIKNWVNEKWDWITLNFNAYIDPAGYVYNAGTLERIPNATVTLQVPDGNGGWQNVVTGANPPISQPDSNPLITNRYGQYQWDTLPGTYRVHVEAPWCHPADSIMVTVPPPVTDLHVGLIPIDVTAPVTSNNYTSTGHSENFTIGLTANDSESGVLDTYYRVNGGELQSVSVDGQPQITVEGANNTLEYFSKDNVGNVENHVWLINIGLNKSNPGTLYLIIAIVAVAVVAVAVVAIVLRRKGMKSKITK